MSFAHQLIFEYFVTIIFRFKKLEVRNHLMGIYLLKDDRVKPKNGLNGCFLHP